MEKRITMKNKYAKNHTFVVCAYKESPYLEECIQSLIDQTIKSNILITTSTPNAHIENIAKKYEIPVKVNEGESGIVQDWNVAYRQVNTDYLTIAHQVDIYLENYVEGFYQKINNVKNPLIYFCNYGEIRNGIAVDNNRLLSVKRIMLKPLEWKRTWNSIWVRRRVLSLGCGICCPSVIYNKKLIKQPPFEVQYRSDEDWQAWEKLSRKKGAFVYNPEIGMRHRVHEESETSIILNDGARAREDYEMFCKFWPRFIAKVLVRFYSSSEKSNQME